MNSIKNKDWLHTHLGAYLSAPEQHKLFSGAIAIFAEIILFVLQQNISEFKAIEDALGIQLEKLIGLAGAELGNKAPNIRKISSDLIVKISKIADMESNPGNKRKIVQAIAFTLKPQKPAIKEQILGEINKETAEVIRKLQEEKNLSPEKRGEDENEGLIYTEPLTEDLKQQLAPLLQYFSEHIVQSMYSQNWTARYAGLTKVIYIYITIL